MGGELVKYNRLGKSDIFISAITFGCWELGGGDKWEKREDEENIRILRLAKELGVNVFDTAVNYGDGHSEKIVGTALKDIRKDCIIATKVRPENLRPKDVRKSFEGSLSRLGTDYIDILYIHWPNKAIPIKDTMSEFNKLKDEKLIKAIGVSNFSIEQIKEAFEYAKLDVIQMEYSLLTRAIEEEILPFCIEHSISVTSYSSLAKGILTGAFHLMNVEIKPDDFRSKRRLFLPEHREYEKELIYLLRDIGNEKDATPAEVAISWILHQEGITSAIVGTQSEKHLRNNLKAVHLELTQEELDMLDKASKDALKKIDRL